MKIKGAELREFMDSAWPKPDDDWYWDHDIFDPLPDPEATYDTDEIGPIQYQGSGDDPTDGTGYNLATLIKKWRKSRTHDTLIVSVQKESMEKFVAVTKSLGGSIFK